MATQLALYMAQFALAAAPPARVDNEAFGRRAQVAVAAGLDTTKKPIVVSTVATGAECIKGYTGYANADYAAMLPLVDANKDGRISVDEMKAVAPGFVVADLNNDKFISQDEWRALIFYQNNPKGFSQSAIMGVANAANKKKYQDVLAKAVKGTDDAVTGGAISAHADDNKTDEKITSYELSLGTRLLDSTDADAVELAKLAVAAAQTELQAQMRR